MSYLEPKIRYMNSVSGSSAGNLPDAEEAYWSYLEDNGQPAGTVEAGEDGLAAGTIQETLQALATRIAALESA